MGLFNSFTKVETNASSGGAIVHKQRRQSSSSTKSSLASEDLPRLELISCQDDHELPTSEDKNRTDCGNNIPTAAAVAGNHAFALNRQSSFSQMAASVNRTTKKVTLPKRWIPKKKSGLFTSFKSSNKNHQHSGDGLTSSRDDVANILQEIKDDDRFKEDQEEGFEDELEGDIDESAKDVGLSSAEPAQQPQPPYQPPVKSCGPQRRLSIVSSDSAEDSLSEELGYDENSSNDLDQSMSGNNNGHRPPDAKSMLKKLGDSSSSTEVANVAAVCANEYINECLFRDNGKQESDTAASPGVLNREKWESIPQYSKSDLLVAKHLGKGSFSDAFEVTVMVVVEEKPLDSSDKEDLDRRIEAKFATTKNIREEGREEELGDDLDVQIDAMFAAAAPSPAPAEPSIDSPPAEPQVQRRPGRARRQTVDHGVSASFCVQKTRSSTRCVRKRVTYAMKCLRPQIRSNVDQFVAGVEDLVHETAILASLDHPNIIKLHGRAICDSLRLSDGYFILLDRLQGTLEDRILNWREMNKLGGKKAQPSLSQLNAACSLASALSYLHSRNVVFRDLKPANVGFDERGVLKLFDFGFAIGVQDSEALYDTCGTPRYMAPEVGLGRGYSMPVDVYSFGIILWEIVSLNKPFADIKSADDFARKVFDKGVRPKLSRQWAPCLKGVMRSCWSSAVRERPAMEVVGEILGAHARDASQQQNNNGGSWRKSFSMRRLTQ